MEDIDSSIVKDPTQLSKIIKSKALEIGFQKVGITSAISTRIDSNRLNDWLKSGKSATMNWISKRQKERGDIHTYFPQAKSIISLGLNYFTGLSSNIVQKGEASFNFSNYAWGQDYHIILKNRIQQLLDSINEVTVCDHSVICVDTSPVMEKVWAQRAGLGWQGKHTNLITRDFGSWLFLGELILSIELEYDSEFEDDLCGSCTACIDACPTGALTDYILDAKRCISYMTIEHRGAFSVQQGNALSGWIFGCDICQEVCPWNKKHQKYSSDSEFLPKPAIKNNSISKWIDLSEDEFHLLFRDSPIKRTKYEGFKRNVLSVYNSDNLD